MRSCASAKYGSMPLEQPTILEIVPVGATVVMVALRIGFVGLVVNAAGEVGKIRSSAKRAILWRFAANKAHDFASLYLIRIIGMPSLTNISANHDTQSNCD